MSAMNKALSLQEIVYHTPWFLPLWEPDLADSTCFNFHPKDLVACIQVSGSWHSILSPLLWKVYDNEEMQHRKITLFDPINLHCRYLKLSTRASGDLQPVNFKSLEVSDAATMDHSMRVLRNNPSSAAHTLVATI